MTSHGPALLANKQTVKEILARHGFEVSKRLGQNFLCDAAVLAEMARAAAPAGEDVLEIGPGLGVLTAALAEEARSVTAVEAARRLEPVLVETLERFTNITILFADFLHVDPTALPDRTFVVAANLPYAITTPALFRFLDGEISWKRIAVMIQAEVAERLAAAPSTPEYGALTISAQAAASIELVCRIPSSAFWPRPKVESAIVRLTPRYGERPATLRAVLRAAFSSRRKTIKNALAKLDAGPEALRASGLAAERRPETLSVAEWIALAKIREGIIGAQGDRDAA